MNNEIEKFLKYLQTGHDSFVENFTSQYDTNDCETIAKMLSKEKWSNDDIKIVKEKYCDKYSSANEFIKSRYTPNEIKHQIVDNILKKKIEGLNEFRLKKMITNTLKNYPNILSSQIKQLFQNYYVECLNCMSYHIPTVNNPSPYCEDITSEFAKLFLDVLNKEIPRPVSFDKQLSPIHCVISPISHMYFIDHMPTNPDLSEFVSTQLINNPFIPDVFKDQVFDTYGYNYTNCDMLYLTSHISTELYNSAIDTLDNYSGYVKAHSRMVAENFLERAISANTFPESIQIDLANRVILQDKEKGSKKMNTTLEHLANFTTSPKVLHIIFEQAPHINNRDSACRNENITIEDLQKQADIYYSKIEKMIKKNTPEKILDKWIDEIDYILKHIPIKNNQYHTILNSNRFSLLSLLISHSNTPPEIVSEATKIIKERFENNRNYNWENLLIKAQLHTELLNRGCCTQPQLDYMCSLFSNSYRLYLNNGNIDKNIYINHDAIYEDELFYEQVVDCFKSVFNSTKKEYFEEIKKLLYQKYNTSNIPGYLIVDNLDKVDIDKLKYRIQRNTDNFRRELREYNAFATIQEYAHRHTLFSKEICDRTEHAVEFNDHSK